MATNNANMSETVGREELMDAMHQLRQVQTQLLAGLEALEQGRPGTGMGAPSIPGGSSTTPNASTQSPQLLPADSASEQQTESSSPPAQKSGFTSRIILTWVDFAPVTSIVAADTDPWCRTYPKQIGINPLPMNWGAGDPQARGPIVVSRSSSTIRRRNGKSERRCTWLQYHSLTTSPSYWR